MVKGFCRTCGSWENLHKDGLCHVHHYGHEEGRAFPQGAATPEEIARTKGAGSGDIVDVQFPPQTGPYADAKRQELDEALARAENEPILGHVTAEGKVAEQPILRTMPEGIDEVEAAKANVEGFKRDVEEMLDPPSAGEVDPAQAGDADLKASVSTPKKDEEAEKPTRQRGAATTARDAGKEKK